MGFPEGYQESFQVFYVFDRPGNKQQRIIYANEQAASVRPGEPFPYGSILVMETWRTKQDEAGNVLLDENGRYQRDALGGIFVMRKEQGFGEAYQHLRTGEWEYVAFRPDKTYSSPPESTFSCAFCHQSVGEQRDWVFRANLAFEEDRYGSTPPPGLDEVLIDSMSFSPREFKVKVGTMVKWTNHDVVPHTTTANDNSWDSGIMQSGGTEFSFTFNTPGMFAYFCALHPAQMRGTIEVAE